jgi:hypothetical protein
MRTTIDQEFLESELPTRVDQVVDMAPIAGDPRGDWLLLGDDGGISRWNPETGEVERLATTAVPAEPGRDPWAGRELRRRLHVSRYATHAAVVNDYGRYGEVIDLRTGRATFSLDNHGDCEETVPFSFTFAEHRGRTVVIHRTEWNRLDVSTADTGAILTVRKTRTALHGEPEPEHYLDYFHGALYLSPSGKRILDDGWVWHPVGIPAVWRLDDWLGRNVWESEDGPSRLDVCGRTSYWDQPMTWLDESRVAIAGIGDDSDNIRQGVRVFDITRNAREGLWGMRAAVELMRFEGPSGTLFSDGEQLFSSGHLGLSIWDPVSAERIGSVAGFTPTHYHPGARELVALDGRTLRRWHVA